MRFLLSVLIVALVCVNVFAFQGHEEIIATVNKANKGWTAGVNEKFKGMSMDKIKRLMGTLKTPPHLKNPVKTHDLTNIQLPAEFDARQQWPNCPTIKEVRDQSDCGSCWAFGATEAASDRICIQTNGTMNYHLSASDLLSCCTSCGDGCNGGYPPVAWQYLSTTGVVTGGNYNDFSWCVSYPFPNCEHHTTGPYPPCSGPEYNTPSCQASCDANSTYPIPYSQDHRIFANAYTISGNVEQIMAEIVTNGPVEADFTVYSDFLTYKSGVYQYTTGQQLGGHAIKILGYGTENGTPYWLCANSWNPTWGLNGFFKILRGSDECGIEDDINAGMWKTN